MATYDALRDLPVQIDDHETETRSLEVSSQFTRRTTIVHVRGAREEGVGEDVTYDPAAHDRFPTVPAGSWTLASLSEALDGVALFAAEPGQQDRKSVV